MNNRLPPPSYAEASSNQTTSHRFPTGLFVLRSRSNLKLLDVAGADTRVGTPIIAYNPKPPILINGDDLIHKENNQLFFIDWHGCLCSASTGLYVDTTREFRLSLNKPRPISGIPSHESHPPAQFEYDPTTRTISVLFMWDHPLTDSANSDYLLEIQPQKQPISSKPGPFDPIDKLSSWFLSSGTTTGEDPSSSSTTTNPEEDDEDLDDSTDPVRQVRVVAVPKGWRHKFPSSGTREARKWAKRQWDIASIVVHPSNDQQRSQLVEPTTTTTLGVFDGLGEAIEDIGNSIFNAFK
ncbi:hypothetical protein MJO29_004118 [Puccinia striiformis f. sp. tritici]|nr:hypothetical protein MJO29_004118 [Puccinia striiformis f. sp. tritici]